MYDIYDNDFDKAFDEAVEAIEKKEHRLIWADALKKHYAWWKDGGYEMTLDEAKNCFDNIVDLQPTVEPTKHGRWKHHQYGNTAGYYECDNCGKINSYKSNYCPNCGTDMREVEDD